jgi:hypothetical protein
MSCGSECLFLPKGETILASEEINGGESGQMTKDAAWFHGTSQISRDNPTENIGGEPGGRLEGIEGWPYDHLSCRLLAPAWSSRTNVQHRSDFADATFSLGSIIALGSK